MKKRVLIVDDDDTNRYLLGTLLRSHGFEVTSAENGREALEKARLDPPDLIITDILMPVMDGYALCREWRADPALKGIPLVFYTASYRDPEDEKLARSLGADRFIIKPQEPDKLLSVLQEILEKPPAVRQAEVRPLGEEMEFFRQHNEILFKKLEKKMSDLERTNQELRILEQRYRLIIENATDVIYTISADLHIKNMSPSVEKILGYKPQYFIGRSVFDLRHMFAPESFSRAVTNMRLVLQGETVQEMVYEFITAEGTTKYGEVSSAPLMRDGEVAGIIAVARDITKRKRAEEALRESEEKYRGILENMDDAYYEVDLNGNLVFFNEALVSKTGYSREELLGMNYRTFISPETCKPVTKVFLEIYGTGRPFKFFDYEVIRKDGQIRNNESWACLLYDSSSRPVGFRGVARDITERKDVEKQLQQTLGSLRRALGATVKVVVSAVESRDPYTAGHQIRVADLARAIAIEMGLSRDRIDGIRIAGAVHDLGKLAVPAEILSRPTKLTRVEFSLIKEHARNGYEILRNVESPWPLAEIVYQHHERMNGSGYPRNLKGDDIIMEARILAVADVVESMASHRPYRPALGLGAALDEIAGNRGSLYDPEVVDAGLRLFREKGYSLVE